VEKGRIVLSDLKLVGTSIAQSSVHNARRKPSEIAVAIPSARRNRLDDEDDDI
jgi:hypothetical protein